MIVLSVLLALAASGWAEGRKQRQTATQARAGFVRELAANHARVQAGYAYHDSLTRAVLAVDSAGGVASYAAWRGRVPFWSGFRPPDLTATAWQSALASGALGALPYAQVSAVSEAYTLQTKLDGFTAGYLPLFDFSDAAMPATVRRMRAYMQTVMSYEQVLLARYDAALAALEARPAAHVDPVPAG